MEELTIFKVSKEEMLKRTKSLLWRAGMMVLALVIDFLIVNLSDINIPAQVVVIVGLVLGEISKQIHKNLDSIKEFAAMGMGKAMGKKPINN